MASPGGATQGNMPVGYRFWPTDEELVGHYLKNKLVGDGSVTQIIAEVDVCKMEPWDLPAFSKVKSDDPEWFFFSPRDLKYTNSNRSNRATMCGYWKATGKDRNIKTRGTNNVIGTKKTLVFYKGRVPHGVKTNWVIHEYHAITVPDFQRTCVLCRLIKKTEEIAKGKNKLINDQPSCDMASDCENQASSDRIPMEYSLPEVDMDPILQVVGYDFSSIRRDPPSQYALVSDACYGNENNSSKFVIETTEVEDNIDEFLNSILINEDVSFNEERWHALVSESAPSESLNGTDSGLLSEWEETQTRSKQDERKSQVPVQKRMWKQ